jgi:hypothetical protein
MDEHSRVTGATWQTPFWLSAQLWVPRPQSFSHASRVGATTQPCH